jgi:acyl-CoA reductase-like NAD-dependent aldehyde dehydrogenase
MTEQATIAATDQGAIEDGRALLERFPNARRSYVANTFLHSVRAGARTPHKVLADVEHALSETAKRSRRWGFTDTVERTETMYSILNEYHDEALAFAAWAIRWEALPPAERERQKAAKGAPHRQAYLEMQPATDKQVAYIQSLGYHGPVTSKAHASTLIEQLKRGEPVEALP